MLEVEPTGQRVRIRPTKVAETATKTSPAPIHKHSLGGCTVELPSTGSLCTYKLNEWHAGWALWVVKPHRHTRVAE